MFDGSDRITLQTTNGYFLFREAQLQVLQSWGCNYDAGLEW